MLVDQMKKQKLNFEQAHAIIQKVFNLATEEFDKKFT